MCDQASHLQFGPRIFGKLVLHALGAYLVWKAIDYSKSNMFKNWFSSGSSSKTPSASACCKSDQAKLLEDPEQKYTVKLLEREEVSHDTRRFRFELPSKNHVLGLPIGQHITVIATINGELVSRSYTPVSSDDDKGYFELVIKVYFKNVHPKFPDGGKLTQHLESLRVGDTIQVRGPKGKLQYLGNGQFSIAQEKQQPPIKKTYKKVSMIAGGTGIAPMLQIIRDVMKKSQHDKTEIALLFANQTEKDILLRTELEEEASKHPNQLKLWYTLDRPTTGWKYSTGFVNKDMIKDHLHPANDDTIVLMCGPPPMVKFVISQLDELEYPSENRFKY